MLFVGGGFGTSFKYGVDTGTAYEKINSTKMKMSYEEEKFKLKKQILSLESDVEEKVKQNNSLLRQVYFYKVYAEYMNARIIGIVPEDIKQRFFNLTQAFVQQSDNKESPVINAYGETWIIPIDKSKVK
jgi:hypothetical protein